MAFILVRYKVENYNRWKNSFNDAFEMRKKYGEKSYRVFRMSDNPNEMVILQEWESLASARRFSKSQKLLKCMEKAGVVGKPDMIFLKELSLSMTSLQFVNI